MQRVVIVNLNGIAYNLEESAYSALGAYLERAAAELRENPDRAEIVADLEQAIERLGGHLGSGVGHFVRRHCFGLVAGEARTFQGERSLAPRRMMPRNGAPPGAASAIPRCQRPPNPATAATGRPARRSRR